MNRFIWLLLAPAAALAAEGTLQVQTVAQTEQVVIDPNGEQQTTLVDVTTVVPGDEVIYTITFTNVGEAPADAVVITDPVPEHMRYIDGSAFGAGTDIRFSVDGGQSWGEPGKLTVIGEDGNPRAARADDYTHIRWSMRHPLAPGKRGFARFRAALR